MAFVAHVQKASRKGGATKQGSKMLALGDLYRHNERVGAYGHAKNIDQSKTAENYTLDGYESGLTYEDRLDAIKERHGILTKERAAAVAAFVISASNEEMAAMDADTQRKFFEDVRDKLGEHFGADTLVYANVHNDEETPHMHIGFVPTDTNEAGKNVIRWGDIKKDRETGEQIERGKVHRNFLKYLQNDLPQELIEKGYKIEIGGKTSTRHIDTAEWRELEEKRKELDTREELVRTLESDTKAAAAKLKADKEQQERVSAAREAALADKDKKQEELQKELDARILEHGEEVAKDVIALSESENELSIREALLETREEDVDEKEKRTTKVLNSVSRAVGLDEAAHEKFMKTSYANIMKDILMKRINERVEEDIKWQRAAQIGNTIEKGKEAGDNSISLYIAGKRDVTPMEATVLGIAARADLKKRMATAPNAIKSTELKSSVQYAKFTDAEAEYNEMLNLLNEKDKEKALKWVKKQAEERANVRRQQAANTSLRSAPKKAAEKAPDLGRSR